MKLYKLKLWVRPSVTEVKFPKSEFPFDYL